MTQLSGLIICIFLLNIWTVCNGDVTCMSCQDVKDPRDCRETTICGKNEICFAREYTDHKGLRGFRLGCESQPRCTMFLKSVIGKRHLPEPAPPSECYECCSIDECNTKLCHGHSGGSITMVPTTTPTKIHSRKDCPTVFLPYKDSCYLFDTSGKTFDEAKALCEGQGANLTSITSQDEQDLLTWEVNGSSFVSYWTGGFYSHTTEEWGWEDGSPFIYTNWESGYPPPAYYQLGHYKLMMANTAHNKSLQTTSWHTATNLNYQAGVICKLH